MKLAIAFLGAAISIGSALLSGVYRADRERAVAALKAEAASLSYEVQKRDRLFDLANSKETTWQQTRLAVRTVAITEKRVFGPSLAFMEDLMLDMLTYGHQAAYGEHPSSTTAEMYGRGAKLIAQAEARAPLADSEAPTEARRREHEEIAPVNVAIRKHRQEHIDLYWREREWKLGLQGIKSGQVSAGEAAVREIEFVGVIMVILGLLIAMLKDLVREPRPAGA